MSRKPDPRLSPTLTALLLLLACGAWSGSAQAKKKYQPPTTLSQWTQRVRAAEQRSGEQWSALVEDLETGKSVFLYEESRRLIVASNRKLITMALALENLGPDFTFKTEFGFNAPHDPQRVHYHGDLVLRSAGDPSFGSPFLEDKKNPVTLLSEWAKALRQTAVVYVHGNVILDASAFGHDQNVYPAVWDERHRQRSYAPIPSALAINQNLLRVTIRPASSLGKPGRARVFPSLEGLSLINVTKTGSRSGAIDARFEPDNVTLKLRGRVNRNKREEIAVIPIPRPLQYYGANLMHALEQEGIRVTGNLIVKLDRLDGEEPRPLARVIGEHRSRPLNLLLMTMMRRSNNFLAEQIWHATAARVTGLGDRATARRIEQRYFRRNGWPWIEPGWDGSGLSHRNLHSAREMVLVTSDLFRSPYRSLLLEALPKSGRNGTMKNRAFSKNGGRVIAKTGTLSGASALTGVIFDRRRQPRLIFSVIGNAPNETHGRLTMRINELIKIVVKDLDADRLP